MAKRHKKQKQRLLAVILFFAAIISALCWGNTSIETEQFLLTSAQIPEGFDGYRVTVLTDLHGALFGENNKTLVAVVEEQVPEAIFLVGDLVDENTKGAAGYAASLGSALADLAPTYYVTGNHEWACGTGMVEEIKQSLTDSGVTVLSNEFCTLSRDGDSIILAGVDDSNGYADQKTPEELRDEVQSAAGDSFSILLSHRDNVEYYDKLGFSLTLCGHGHGGIFRIPFLDRGILGTNRHFFPAYDGGLYAFDSGNACFVSRGLGNIGMSFRVFNRPQVAVITLKRG